MNPSRDGDFDYTNICDGGFSFGMNQSSYSPDGKLDSNKVQIILRPDTNRTKKRTDLPATAWCVACVHIADNFVGKAVATGILRLTDCIPRCV
jgi:hypothetical protein